MEEMNYVFGVTTKRHVTYQLQEVLPWYFHHYIRRQSVKTLGHLAPLYRYSRLMDTAETRSSEDKVL